MRVIREQYGRARGIRTPDASVRSRVLYPAEVVPWMDIDLISQSRIHYNVFVYVSRLT